jgi:thymidylate synthase
MSGIPVLIAKGKSLAEAWEKSVFLLYKEGCDFKTEYDKPNDPASKDATMTVVVEEPMSEPFVHRAFPGGPADLEEYRQEVLDGIKDHWVRDPNNLKDTRWEYTYHERLFSYRVPTNPPIVRNQIDAICKKLAEAPHTRRCNAITWKVWDDFGISDPPCLQSIWCRIQTENDIWHLNMNVRFRSRDAYDAAFMNMYALIHLQDRIAERVSRIAKRPVKLGRYCDVSDSYHIYGSRLKDFEGRVINLCSKRSFEDRTWTREDIKEMVEEAREMILEKVCKYDEEHSD